MPRPFALIGFSLFFVISLLFNREAGTVVIFLVLFTAVLVFSAIKKNRFLSVTFLCCSLGCLLILGFNEFFYNPIVNLAGETMPCSVVTEDEGQREYGSFIYKATVREANGEKTNFRIMLYSDEAIDADAFDTLSGNLTFSKAGASGKEFSDSKKAEGVFLNGRFEQPPQVTKANSFVFKKAIFSLRQGIKKSLFSAMSEGGAALSVSLLLGDRTALPASLYSNLKAVGVTHIICVSGLHLSLWSTLVLFVLEKLRIKKKYASLLAVPFIILFMLVAGMTYSVIRAGIMMIVFLAARFFDRESDSLNSLGLALTAIAVTSPFAMGSMSLQLSALSTLGLILYAGHSQNLQTGKKPHESKSGSEIKSRLYGGGKKIGSVISATFFAVLFTLPVLLTGGQGFTPVIFISNLLIVFAAEGCMLFSSLAAVAGLILPQKLNIFAFWANLLCRYIGFVAEKLAKLNVFTFSVNERQNCLILAFFFLFAAFSVIIVYRNKKAFGTAAVACFLVLTVPLTVISVSDRQITRLRIIDVGNGISVLAQKGSDALLIGCGGDDEKALKSILAPVNSAKFLPDLLLPDTSPAFTRNLSGYLKTKPTGKICLNQGNINSALLLSDADICTADEFNTFSFLSIKTYNDDNNRHSYLLSDDNITLLIIADPEFDTAYLDKEATDAEVLLCCSEYPENLSFDCLKLLVFSADNTRGISLMNELKEEGLNVTCTAGNSDLTAECKNHCVSTKRGD